MKAAISHVETVRVGRTGINALLWIVGLATPTGLAFSTITGNAALRWALFAVAVVPPTVAIIAWFVLLFRRPEMLESEEYRLQRYALFQAFRPGASPESLEASVEIARFETGTVGVQKKEQP